MLTRDRRALRASVAFVTGVVVTAAVLVAGLAAAAWLIEVGGWLRVGAGAVLAVIGMGYVVTWDRGQRDA